RSDSPGAASISHLSFESSSRRHRRHSVSVNRKCSRPDFTEARKIAHRVCFLDRIVGSDLRSFYIAERILFIPAMNDGKSSGQHFKNISTRDRSGGPECILLGFTFVGPCPNERLEPLVFGTRFRYRCWRLAYRGYSN